MNSEQYIAGAILISGEQVLGAIRGLSPPSASGLRAAGPSSRRESPCWSRGSPSTRSPLPPRPGGRAWSCRIPFWQS